MPTKTSTTHTLILPECAANQATMAEQVRGITSDLAHIAETIYGNSKPGLKETLETNTRDITEVAKILKEINESRKEESEMRLKEVQIRKDEIKERKGNALKWWLGLMTAIIMAGVAIARDISTQAILLSFTR